MNEGLPVPVTHETGRGGGAAAAYDPTVGERAGSPSPTAAASRWQQGDDLDSAEYGVGYPAAVGCCSHRPPLTAVPRRCGVLRLPLQEQPTLHAGDTGGQSNWHANVNGG